MMVIPISNLNADANILTANVEVIRNEVRACLYTTDT